LYICDNVLWSGRVIGAEELADDQPGRSIDWQRSTTEAIVEHNRLIAEDERFLSTIVPTRDGVMVALRLA
jgi:caffeoyl-CoA O-methyltransferase